MDLEENLSSGVLFSEPKFDLQTLCLNFEVSRRLIIPLSTFPLEPSTSR